MQLLGHPLIPYTQLKSISSIDEMEERDDTILLFEYEPKLINYANTFKRDFALHIFNQTEAIIGNGAGANILICSSKIATSIQELAEYYLFDAKVAILINKEDEISIAIDKKVDMAILPDAIL